MDLHQSLAFEQQRFPDRDTADAELPGKLFLAQLMTGGNIAPRMRARMIGPYVKGTAAKATYERPPKSRGRTGCWSTRIPA